MSACVRFVRLCVPYEIPMWRERERERERDRQTDRQTETHHSKRALIFPPDEASKSNERSVYLDLEQSEM